MTLDAPSLLAWFIVGMLTGAIGTEFVAGRGHGQWTDIGIGILGGVLGGLALNGLGLQGQPGLLLTTFSAFVGAVLLTALGRVFARRMQLAGHGAP